LKAYIDVDLLTTIFSSKSVPISVICIFPFLFITGAGELGRRLYLSLSLSIGTPSKEGGVLGLSFFSYFLFSSFDYFHSSFATSYILSNSV